MNILFICTHNRCRSILAEAVCRHISQQQNANIHSFSAGSEPEGQVHPLSIKYLTAAGIDTSGLKSQSWDAFENHNIDLAITVCDSAAGEQCPLYLGKATKIHWGLQDPSRLPEVLQAQGFQALIQLLAKRIQLLIDTPKLEQLDNDALKQLMQSIENETPQELL